MNPHARSLPATVVRFYSRGAGWIDAVQPAFALAVRLYVARVFFLSGLTKLRDWDITVALFTNEYHVPFFMPEVAAALGTTAEVGLPVLLALGLGSRAAAAALFVFNIVAVISYPDLSDAGLVDHMLWGALMLVTLFYGPGRISLDHWLGRRYS
ncbi:MAG TPA: DoxX family protein [Usitatibacter sp.]|jgi:putative oxidoreductase|nr:DoxX family protein [Usitatibacter sp.]